MFTIRLMWSVAPWSEAFVALQQLLHCPNGQKVIWELGLGFQVIRKHAQVGNNGRIVFQIAECDGAQGGLCDFAPTDLRHRPDLQRGH